MKNIIMKVILFFLYRGIRVLEQKDMRVRDEFLLLPDEFSLGIVAGLNDKSPSVYIKKTENGIIREKRSKQNPDISIVFKNKEIAYKTLLGKISIDECYARHGFMLKGNINDGMAVVRIFEIVEAYLFPRFITNKILKRHIKRKHSIGYVYMKMLFGG